MKEKEHSRYRRARAILIFWCLFIGLGAVAGSVGMLSAPDGSALGMEAMLPYFQVLPFADVLFQDFTFAGIALLCVNGLPNLIAAGLLLARRKAGVICGGVFGVTLMLWICIQFVIFPLNFMSTIYFLFGLAQAATGYAALIFDRQERFAVREEDYPRIGTDPSRLVVYVSRMGYTKRAALEEAERTGAEVLALHTPERTAGTLGFWWCGRFAMHRWAMPVDPPDRDLSRYQHVTLCSPVWDFHLSAVMRGFCTAAAGQIREADYIITHFQRLNYAAVADEMDALLGLRRTGAVSICVRTGRELWRHAV